MLVTKLTGRAHIARTTSAKNSITGPSFGGGAFGDVAARTIAEATIKAGRNTEPAKTAPAPLINMIRLPTIAMKSAVMTKMIKTPPSMNGVSPELAIILGREKIDQSTVPMSFTPPELNHSLRHRLLSSKGHWRVTVRVSLRTSSMSEARARAAFLKTEMMIVAAQVEETLKIKLAHDDLKLVCSAAFKSALSRYVVNRAMTLMYADAHAASNLIYARLFTLLTSSAKPLEADVGLREELVEKGLSAREADATIAVLSEHGNKPLVSANYVFDYLRSAGIQPTEPNSKAVARVIAIAYRNACLGASNAMGRPINPNRVWAILGGLDHMLGLTDKLPKAAFTAAPPPCQALSDQCDR